MLIRWLLNKYPDLRRDSAEKILEDLIDELDKGLLDDAIDMFNEAYEREMKLKDEQAVKIFKNGFTRPTYSNNTDTLKK